MPSPFGRTATTSSATSALSSSTAASTPENGVTLVNGPDDSISTLSFSPATNHLAVASLDGKVRIYDLTNSATGQGRAFINFDGPVLSCDWSEKVAAHDAPIRSLRFFQAPQANATMLVTGSWDKTVRYWDLRQSAPVASIRCQERIYSMDVKDQLLVIATADRYINVINLQNPTSFYKIIQSLLKWQTRVVTCFNDATGFAFGGIEGRCDFQYVEDKDTSQNFTFKCHRDQPINNTVNVHAVNAISCHPIYGTFSTGASDGTYQFWDKDSHHRLKAYPPTGGSISTTAFNGDGSLLAYAVSYDWSKGYMINRPDYPIRVMIHPVQADECKPKVQPNRR